MKKLFWLESAKKGLATMPDTVQDTFGYALYLAQIDMDPIRERLRAAEAHATREPR